MTDIDDIRMLTARYNRAGDSDDRDAWLACFAPDGSFGRVDLGTEHRGLEAIARMSDGYPVHGRHVTVDHIIEVEVDGDRATQTCTLLFFDAERGYALHMVGTYDDTLVRRDGHWLFLDRRLTANFLAQDDSRRAKGDS
ncbi:MAG TPA: nuclear transport factor 2 family protein [Pseudolysinimonas sp.]